MNPISNDASAAAISAALAQLDIPAAEAALAEAEAARRQLLLATTDDAPIIKAEQAITSARIARDRVLALQEDLTRRLAEAQSRERREALQTAYDEAASAAADVERGIRKEYARAAAKLVALAEAEAEADKQVVSINRRLLDDDGDLPPLKPAGERVWADYHEAIRLREVLSLPPVGDFPGHGAAALLLTKERAWAIGESHRGPVVPSHSYA